VTQATDAYDNNLESARRKAAMMAVTAVCGISLLTKDVTILTLGGATVIGLDFAARHSIVTHPATGQIVTQTMRVPTLSAVSE
jgi:hypothetical protein